MREIIKRRDIKLFLRAYVAHHKRMEAPTEEGYDRPSAKFRELVNPEFQEIVADDFIEGRITEERLRQALLGFSKEGQD